MPDFVVLTGVNGSGKSHLLEAMTNGHVVLEGMDNVHTVLFNYETFKLGNESPFNVTQLSAERESAWQYYEQHIKRQAPAWRAPLGTDYGALKDSCQNDKKSLWSVKKDNIALYKNNVEMFFRQSAIRQNANAPAIYSLIKQLPCGIDEIAHDEFIRLYNPLAFTNDFLPAQLGKVFWDYYLKRLRNDMNEFRNTKYAKSHEVKSDAEFISMYGKPPWDVVNEVLATFDALPYRVTSPDGLDYLDNFHLKLKHIEKPNLEIEFSRLSSGERVLMALVASVYKTSADKHFPGLLLLDEVDASLHPSMMKNMLDVIESVFIHQGVKVMLVTHSPTTLALAAENSIYVMNRSGTNRIEKKSKQEALSILTQGFATIEQGLKLLDEVARSPITIITEGYNTVLIAKALELHGVTGVDVLCGLEGASGKDQLKVLFQFFAMTSHKNKVIFVWDCDVSYDLQALNCTFPFVLPRNNGNSIAQRGIENAFPEALFGGYINTTSMSDGGVRRQFDTKRKRDFESFVISRSEITDFGHFLSLVAEIERVRAATAE